MSRRRTDPAGRVHHGDVETDETRGDDAVDRGEPDQGEVASDREDKSWPPRGLENKAVTPGDRK